MKQICTDARSAEKTNASGQVSELPLLTHTGGQQKSVRWRTSITVFAIPTFLVLVVNISIAINATSRYGWSPVFGFKPIFIGQCNTTKQLNTVLHLLINILSSILLSGSNYSMQVLAAPSREHIDDAHSKRGWLDIGVPSVRNLRALSTKWKALWWLFVLSSIPLHLL